jgi:hypothetical protein
MVSSTLIDPQSLSDPRLLAITVQVAQKVLDLILG